MAASQAAWLNLERKVLEMVLVWVSLRMAAISAEKLDFERNQNTSDGSNRKFS